jgi:hypothetical protein
MSKDLRIKFVNVREIRMGSPYNLCEIRFSGEWIPPLPTEDWQDLKAISPDGRYVALVMWNTKGNLPGFHVVRIDTRKRKYHKTKRIMGLCRKISWDQGRFVWQRG